MGNSSVHAAMLGMLAGSRSVGCHVVPGNSRANAAACCPVPAATSRARGGGGASSFAMASMMGAQLRSAAGAILRAAAIILCLCGKAYLWPVRPSGTTVFW